jgi:hypothetical protein
MWKDTHDQGPACIPSLASIVDSRS